MSTRGELPTKGQKQAKIKSAWETILNGDKRNEANCNRQGVEEQHVKPEPTLDKDDESIAIALHEVISDEVKSHMANALATILHKVEGAVEQLFRAATLSAQGRVRTMVYSTVKHVVLDKIRTAVLRKMVKKHVDQYFGADKVVEAFGKRLRRNDELLAPKALFVRTQMIDAITDQQRVDVLGFTSVVTGAQKDTAMPADANLVH